MYGKIFESMFDSSLIVAGGIMAAYTFIGMIVLADESGFVRFDEKALGRRIGLPEGEGTYPVWEDYRLAIKILEGEDERSNLPDHNGRRIIPLKEITEGKECRGWWIVNYEYYRKLSSREDRRNYMKDYMKKYRSVNKCKQS